MEQIQDVIEQESIPESEAKDTLGDKYLTFKIGSESYGIELRFVTEIVVMQEITKMPDMPGYIRGVINLRGNVLSVMDMRSRFNFEQRDYDGRTCIVVVEVKGRLVGLIVDSVKEVLTIPADQVDPPPQNHTGFQSTYVKGMGKIEGKVTILLDTESILYEEETAQIQ